MCVYTVCVCVNSKEHSFTGKNVHVHKCCYRSDGIWSAAQLLNVKDSPLTSTITSNRSNESKHLDPHCLFLYCCRYAIGMLFPLNHPNYLICQMYPPLSSLSLHWPPTGAFGFPIPVYFKLDKQQPNRRTESHIVCPSNGFSSPISRAADEKEAID